MSYILVLDQGTHASRAIVFSLRGDIIEKAEQSVSLHPVNHQNIEQDAGELLESLKTCLNQLSQDTVKKITRCCITTQRSTMVAWDKISGEAFGPAISWQDRRSDDDLKQFIGKQSIIKHITGLPLSAHYGSGKIRWLMTHNPLLRSALKKNTLVIAPLVSFLLFNLLNNRPCVVDHSNAHRSLLFNLKTLNWSNELLCLFNIPASILPECKPVKHDYGTLNIHNIPVTSVCGDQSAAFFSQGTVDNDTAIINIGTGAFILAPCNNISQPSALLYGIACSDENSHQYLLEGTVNGAGAALSWAQNKYPVENLFQQLPGWLKQIQSPPVFINTVGGLGSPWWCSAAEAYFINDEQVDTAARYVAIIDSIAFLIQHNLQLIQKSNPLTRLKISGGLSRLDGLCQKISDLSQLKVERIIESEATALGGAWLAADCPRSWPSDSLNQEFTPQLNPSLAARFHLFSDEIHRFQ